MGERSQTHSYRMKGASLGVRRLILKKRTTARASSPVSALPRIKAAGQWVSASGKSHFISRPSLGCNVRQFEKKLILGVGVSPADGRSRLKDKLLITVQGAGSPAIPCQFQAAPTSD